MSYEKFLILYNKTTITNITHNTMTKNKIYLEPEVRVIELSHEGSVFAGSVQKEVGASGEDITWGDQFDPWA